MAQIREITAHFENGNKYFENTIGNEFYYTQSTGPYEYLLGALAGCYTSTLYSYERKTNINKIDINIQGIKRETVPTTLEKTTITVKAYGVSDKEEFSSLAKRASEDCSIYQTISKVSEMILNIEFED